MLSVLYLHEGRHVMTSCHNVKQAVFNSIQFNSIQFNSIQFNSDICTRQLMNITLARTAKKKTKKNNKEHE